MKRIVLVVMILMLVGCSDFSEIVTVSNHIDKYTAVMSSYPAMPIDISFTEAVEDSEGEIELSCTKGEFVTWEDGIVTYVGNSYTIPVEDQTFYWSPLGDTIEETTEITMTYKQYTMTFSVESEDGFYSVKY